MFGKVTLTLIIIYIIYLYNYAFFCNWVYPESNRIVLLADPQMEGDSRVQREGLYGQLNNDFNDYYFKHIFSNINSFLKPDYVFVLGDIFSSQYISDYEFSIRKNRYEIIIQTMVYVI
jgi:hypothetical protein